MSLSQTERAMVRERRVKLAAFLLILLVLFLSVSYISNLLVSFVLAVTGYYLISPAVDFLERRGLPRAMAATIPFVFFSLVIFALAKIFFPVLVTQFAAIKTDLPKYADATVQFFSRIESRLSSVLTDIYPMDLKAEIAPKITEWGQSIFSRLPEIVSKSVTVLLLAPFLTYFMLVDGRDFTRRILSLVPNNLFELALNLNYQVGSQMGGYIRARMLQSFLVFSIIWVGLKVIGFPYALVLAAVAGVLNVIPYLGPILGALPALIINFANQGSSGLVWSLLFVYALAQVIDTVVITPFIVAKIVNMHPVTVVLVIIVGAQWLGVLGMIISIPVFCALKVSSIAIYKHLTDFRA